MATVYCIGETVYDIIFRDGQPVAASTGGSMLNTAVSLGRSGINVEMITELGDDQVGELVLSFLRENGVGASSIQPVKGFKTPVSLAFLDNSGNARYSFYKNYPKDRLKVEWPMTQPGDIIMFGSFYSLDPAVHEKIASFLASGREKGAFIVYDPNIRRNHLDEVMGLMGAVEENISLADLVRGSDEDFGNLFGLENGDDVFYKLSGLGCMGLIYTCSDKGAWLYSGGTKMHEPARKIQVVSTIGAGDSFNAGIITGLAEMGNSPVDLMSIDEEQWRRILKKGVDYASEVCQVYDNYISWRNR